MPSNGQTLFRTSTTLFELEYESSGASACSLYAEKGPYPGSLSLWYSVGSMPTAYSWGQIALPPYQYRWTITCNGQGQSVDNYVHIVVPY